MHVTAVLYSYKQPVCSCRKSSCGNRYSFINTASICKVNDSAVSNTWVFIEIVFNFYNIAIVLVCTGSYSKGFVLIDTVSVIAVLYSYKQSVCSYRKSSCGNRYSFINTATVCKFNDSAVSNT